ncbi:MAG: DUF3368 domain-containing protein [Myxococcaceae bacterium]
MAEEVWVVNSSPTILLAKSRHLDLLLQLSREVLVPEAVASEILKGPPTDPARGLIEGGWGIRVPAAATPPSVVEWGLGAGETAVIATGLSRPGSTLVLDDAAARACARAFGLPVIGTLGVVLRAKKTGMIESASAVLRALRSAGLYLDALIRDALARVAGEVWEP